MRQWHFIENSIETSLPRHFAHFIFDLTNSGFRVVKQVLMALQQRTLPKVGVAEFANGIVCLRALAYQRVVRQRLFVPPLGEILFQLDLEQTSDPRNRVYHSDKRDRWGRRVATIDWSVMEQDYDNVRTMARRILSRWPAQSRRFPRLLPIDHDRGMSKPYDAYHPVHTCRMGSDSRAPVDLDLKVKGSTNLYALTTGVLPSAGSANPTFTMLCLGEMLAGHLQKCQKDPVVLAAGQATFAE